MKVEVRQVEGDDAAAREFARADILARALLHASLEEPLLRAHSRHLAVLRHGRVVGLAAQIDDVFPYRSAPIAATLPGVTSALLAELDAPLACLAPEMQWRELERLGAQQASVQLQMARLHRLPLPDPDPGVKRIDDPEELARVFGTGFSPLRLQLGPFFAVRDGQGELVAAGGVEFVTDSLAQLAFVHTREPQRRQGLARSVVVELLRELESRERSVILQVRIDNQPAIELYRGLGFRGTRRLAKYTIA